MYCPAVLSFSFERPRLQVTGEPDLIHSFLAHLIKCLGPLHKPSFSHICTETPFFLLPIHPNYQYFLQAIKYALPNQFSTAIHRVDIISRLSSSKIVQYPYCRFESGALQDSLRELLTKIEILALLTLGFKTFEARVRQLWFTHRAFTVLSFAAGKCPTVFSLTDQFSLIACSNGSRPICYVILGRLAFHELSSI